MQMLSIEACLLSLSLSLSLSLFLDAQGFMANSLYVRRYGSDFYPGGDAMLNREINVYSAVGGSN